MTIGHRIVIENFKTNLHLQRYYRKVSPAHSARLTLFGVDLPKAVVTHLVHEAVEQYRGPFPVHSELALRGVVVLLLDVTPLLRAASNTDHPQELVYV